jgi:hypothetical protein
LNRTCSLIACVLLLASCTHRHHAKSGEIEHVVICWLKDHGNAQQQQQLIDASQDLKKIPGVLDLRIGHALPSTRPVVDSTYDLGLVIRFRDEASLRAYEHHPIHQKLVRELLRPLTGRIVVYDFRRQ